jgi:type II secretory pathway pseudopilin PulG
MVEILLVIAIIGIMASLVLTVIGGAAQDSHAVVARQQQVVVQEALNAWIANVSSQGGGIAAARSAYNAAGSDSAKLALLQSYLGGDTYNHLTDANFASGSGIGSASLQASGLSLTFSTWTATNYPSVQLE